MYSNYTKLKQEPKKQEGHLIYHIEKGEIVIKIAKEGWKNFKNALDLYALSRNQARLSDKEIYEFIRPFDKKQDDIFNKIECWELRRRARELYDISILGDSERFNERNLGDVEPGMPDFGYSPKTFALDDAIYKK